MPSKRSKLLNHLLRQWVREPLANSQDVHAMRQVAARHERLRFFSPYFARLKRESLYLEGIPCEWHTVPQSQHSRTLLYFHGGGFCIKTPKAHSFLLGQLCRAAGARGLMVDYRLAPEAPFPAAVEDCFAVYRALLKQVPAQSIVLGGDSAGGNLVLTTLLKAKQQGLALPAGAFMMSPCVDGGALGSSESRTEKPTEKPTERPAQPFEDPFFRAKTLRCFRDAYLQGADPQHPLVSVINSDLSGLPPMMIQVGDQEYLLSDSQLLATCARESGVNVQLTVWPGQPHVFPAFPFLPEGRQAIDQMGAFARACWG